MNRVPKQSRSSPQTLPAAKLTRRRKPLSDRNSSSSTSSDAPLPPKGCFRFLLSNSNSRSTPRKSPKPNEQSSAASSRPRCRSRALPLVTGGKEQSSQEIAKNGGVSTASENGTCPCPFSSSNGNCTISTPGRVNEQGPPPVQASISPEIHCGSEVVQDGSACFAAGHLVSNVKDRRKCRPRGILTVGENMKLGVEMDCKVNASGIVPMPAEASVRWLPSPGDTKGSSQSGSSRSPSCSPRDGIEVGKDGRFRKLGWEMGGPTGVHRYSDAEADAGNGSVASPWNETGTVIEQKYGSLNKAAQCYEYSCEDEESSKIGLHCSPRGEVKVEFENRGGSKEATNSCTTDSYSEDSQKKSFAFDRDELTLGETMWFRGKDCSDSFELGPGIGGADDHDYCRSREIPTSGSFAFCGFGCSASEEVELGFQYNWVKSPSRFRAKDGILEPELGSKNSFRSDNCEVSVTYSEIKPVQSLLEVKISDRSETSCTCVGESASARCDLQATSKALSSTSESNYKIQNHPDEDTDCFKFQENRHEEASPRSEEASFCECKKLLACADISESTGTSVVTVSGGNMFDVDPSIEVSLLPLEKPCSESRRLLLEHRSESNGRDRRVGNQVCSPRGNKCSKFEIRNCKEGSFVRQETPAYENKVLFSCPNISEIAPGRSEDNQVCSPTGNKCSKFEIRNCKEGSFVRQETPAYENKVLFSCPNISEIAPGRSPSSDGSLWNLNAMCTPSTDSGLGSFEPNSMDEVLQTLRETHDRSDFLPLPGFDFQFYCPGTPYHSASGARVWDPSTDLDAISLEELHEQGNKLLTPTFDNISHMRISWRGGLVSRMFEMHEFDINDRKLEAEGKADSEQIKAIPVFDFDHAPNLGSPVLDDEKLLQLSSGFGSFELFNGPQDLGTKDIDWKMCYRNSLFEETA